MHPERWRGWCGWYNRVGIYGQYLEGNLQRLLDRAKAGTYRAPPVRRVNIPKGGSSFLNCAYGFRSARSAHQALNTFRTHLMTSKVAGSLRWISRRSSTIWITVTCGSFFTFGCVMACCCA
jgi:hypothetical protein